MRDFLNAAVTAGALRAVDVQFADHMARLAGGDDPHLLLAAALVSHRVGEGDVCVDLRACGELPLFQSDGLAVALTGRDLLPALDTWTRALQASPVVGRPGERAPLILDAHQRCYLGRYWHFEQVLATALQARAPAWAPAVDRDRLRAGLAGVVADSGSGSEPTDWQRVAAAVAVLRPLCIISGGPGTGKTRTVTSILALLVEQAARPVTGQPPGQVTEQALRIALTAPTGKAAARLTESIRLAKAQLPLTPATAAGIPDEAVTLHRLLGFRPGRANPRHGPDNPLHLDVVVVDEASMVDLPLMARLLEALPEQARLILLGDKDQLSSVEAGMVLGDICGGEVSAGYSREQCAVLKDVANTELDATTQTAGGGIGDNIVVLKKSWRFDDASGIGALARAVNRGDGDLATAVLDDPGLANVRLDSPHPAAIDELIASLVVPVYRDMVQASDPGTALALLNRIRVLCAVREGPYGVYSLNRRIEQALAGEGLITGTSGHYAGRPVMVTTNDHARRLYNGDVGLVLADADADGALRVFFETAEGIRRVLPSRLPPHETVYAMTVHKSQGSEFADVLLVLPDVDSQVVTRELVYTGITRAKEGVVVIANAERLREAVARRVTRATGLRDALWGDSA